MNHFQKYLVEEFAEDYQEGHLSRREALKLIAAVTGSMIVATTFLASCAPPEAETAAPPAPTEPVEATKPAAAEAPTSAPTQAPEEAPYGTVSPDDPAVAAGAVTFPGGSETLMGYQARPAGDGAYPVILVCHENRGLTEHIQDVTRRLAKAGYTALAVDLLSRQGGTQAVGSGEVPGVLGSIDPEQFAKDFISGWSYLQGQSFAIANRVGMVGFCFGGGVTWLMATRMPELLAAVPFYGPNPPLDDVPLIQAAVLAIYGEQDERINAGIPAVESAMQQNQKTFEKMIYPNAGHAFHNDTGTRYNADAARDAWQKTLEWFAKYV